MKYRKRQDPAFEPRNANLNKNSTRAIELSLTTWAVERQRRIDPLISPRRASLTRHLSGTLRLFDKYQTDRVEVIAHMLACAAHACSDLEAAWQSLRMCFVRASHGSIRSSLEATMTAVTFADPDLGPKCVKDYVNDSIRVSGVFERFEQTAPKLKIPQSEVEFVSDYLKQWLHPMTHPAAQSTRLTILDTKKGVAIGNYYSADRDGDYRAIAANIVNVAERIRALFQSAVPSAYVHFGQDTSEN